MAAGLNLGELFIQLGVDDSRLNRVLSRNTKKLQTFSNGFQGLARVATSSFASIASGAAILGSVFIKAASDMQELQNVIDVTFESSSRNIDKWSKEVSGGMNRAIKDMKEFAGTAGAGFKAVGFGTDQVLDMAKAVAELSQDMSSFRNTKPSEAFTALQSAIMGVSTRPIRRYGADVTEASLQNFALSKGIKKSVEAMNQQEKVLLRLQLIQSQLNFLQGDAARTSDKLANSMKGVKAGLSNVAVAIGNQLLPSAEKFINSLDKMIDLAAEVDFGKVFNSKTIKNITSVTKAITTLYGTWLIGSLAVSALSNPFVKFGLIATTVIGAIQTDFMGLTTTLKSIGDKIKDVGIFFRDGFIFIGEMGIDAGVAIGKALTEMWTDPEAAFLNFIADFLTGLTKMGKGIIDLIEAPLRALMPVMADAIEIMATGFSRIGAKATGSALASIASDIRMTHEAMKGIKFTDIIGTTEAIEELEKFDASTEKTRLELEKIEKAGEEVKKTFRDLAEGKEFPDFISAGLDKIKDSGGKIKDAVVEYGKEFSIGLGDSFKTDLDTATKTLVSASDSWNNIFDKMLGKTKQYFKRDRKGFQPMLSAPGAGVLPEMGGVRTPSQGVLKTAENSTRLEDTLYTLGNSFETLNTNIFNSIPQVSAFRKGIEDAVKAAEKQDKTATLAEKLTGGFSNLFMQSKTFGILLEKLNPVIMVLEKEILRPLANAFIGLLKAIGWMIQWIPGAVGKIGKELNNLDFITETDYATDTVKQFGDELSKVNQSLTNLPTGIKLASKIFEARSDVQLATVSQTPSTTGTKRATGATAEATQGAGGGIEVRVEGNVFGVDNMKAVVKEAIAEMNLITNGTSIVSAAY